MARSLESIFTSGAGGGGISWSVITTNTTATVNTGYIIDASGSAVTLTLPASPTAGDVVGVAVSNSTNVVTVARNGNLILGVAEDKTITGAGNGIQLVYTGATFGWASTTEIAAGPEAVIPTAFWGKITDSEPVLVVSAVTATLNKMHRINAASAAYTITVPVPVGNAGAVVGFKVLSSSVHPVTIDIELSEAVDGVASLQMHKNGVLLLVSDGNEWLSLVRNLAPDVYVEASSNAGQAITGTTSIQYEDIVTDTHGSWDGSTFTAPVDGVYTVYASVGRTVATAFQVNVFKNGTPWGRLSTNATTDTSVASGSASIKLTQGQTISLRPSTDITRSTTTYFNIITITRIGD